MLKKFGQKEARPLSTPADHDLNVKLQKEDGAS